MASVISAESGRRIEGVIVGDDLFPTIVDFIVHPDDQFRRRGISAATIAEIHHPLFDQRCILPELESAGQFGIIGNHRKALASCVRKRHETLHVGSKWCRTGCQSQKGKRRKQRKPLSRNTTFSKNTHLLSFKIPTNFSCTIRKAG